MAEYSDEVEFRGHPLVRSLHRNTIEVTRDAHLTLRGDCIIGVKADKGLTDLSSQVRDALCTDGARVSIEIVVGERSFLVRAFGSSALTMESHEEMVIRKSAFPSPRTLAVYADAAAKDIPREVVESLRSPESRGTLRLQVQTP